MIDIFIFIIGVVIGSFLNVCIYRIPNEESIVSPPSHCGSCNHKLAAKDLVPIFSYLFLKGRCRYCKEKVSIRYLLVELFTGIVFLAIYEKYGLALITVKYILAASIMIVISLIDFDTTDVYQEVTHFGIGVAVIFDAIEIFKYNGDFKNYLIAVLIAGITFGIIVYLICGMGAGDLDIALIGSLFLGWKLTIFMILTSFILGGIIGVILVLLKIKSKKDYIPFGPYIGMGFLLAIFIGSTIIEKYYSFLL
ncbi:type 4 prepilin peptidase 1 . Aspartic peptidase. MEROPS family A24A [Clostridium cavendishii DSM 21758]|uniref:Type 4 prepilin peptidase 1. Aspartic peptidase. MEROPS family A24A n=1 Tax=Clostridium cavendishii DSM 21758 TaxID=1121302 RepID=A0A1M6LK03_9CLOT|nr:A24 family peptidase [Clostridium cavendishii]SHJ71521.1 type 4 prepilin peptidase 1 . Aspartic peptidase. MEROPS family A24A [Clostridium cavendishii DSM 21758]